MNQALGFHTSLNRHRATILRREHPRIHCKRPISSNNCIQAVNFDRHGSAVTVHVRGILTRAIGQLGHPLNVVRVLWRFRGRGIS